MQELEVISENSLKHPKRKHNPSQQLSSDEIQTKGEVKSDAIELSSQKNVISRSTRHLRVKLLRFAFSPHRDSLNDTAESPLETRIRTQVERFKFLLISQGFLNFFCLNICFSNFLI